MWGSTIPTEYYGFYCDPALQKIYWFTVESFYFLWYFIATELTVNLDCDYVQWMLHIHNRP